MRILAVLLLALASSSTFAALPSVEDVQHAVHRGDYVAAESMVRDVLAARPDNAKAHYILAELLAHEGKLGEARTQAATAQQLDPAIHFTAPEKFRQFQAELGGGARGANAPRKIEEPVPAQSSGGGSSVFWLLLVIGLGAVFLFTRRRPQAPGYGSYPSAPTGVPPGTPGYPNAYPPGYPPPSSGVSPVVAGLGGVAAGMVAEHLIEQALDRHHHDTPQAFEHPSAPESVQDRPIDFGNGSDWGGDSGGGGDAGGGFDSGSGGDWS